MRDPVSCYVPFISVFFRGSSVQEAVPLDSGATVPRYAAVEQSSTTNGVPRNGSASRLCWRRGAGGQVRAAHEEGANGDRPGVDLGAPLACRSRSLVLDIHIHSIDPPAALPPRTRSARATFEPPTPLQQMRLHASLLRAVSVHRRVPGRPLTAVGRSRERFKTTGPCAKA
ncbi:hypothetical protein BU26DRAFT_829 [Trematosphaeria pertusa]|uniref:Uncharacterized protein n=1 Tax=Trematosphaeria pertusa TaxID=390896 RepID=A0A6A6J206_9PLEO|nr:uncharacterized protein BU26DRAFT_829 [Trematosphaeria pertusa]KAF2255503.1 hypothetical protein BU26DRAFT_829 [Trematosphaeria pertusa]